MGYVAADDGKRAVAQFENIGTGSRAVAGQFHSQPPDKGKTCLHACFFSIEHIRCQ